MATHKQIMCRCMGSMFKPMPKHFDHTQWARGTKVEMEHTNNPQVARLIAAQHLAEMSNYYTMLAKVEKKKRS